VSDVNARHKVEAPQSDGDDIADLFYAKHFIHLQWPRGTRQPVTATPQGCAHLEQVQLPTKLLRNTTIWRAVRIYAYICSSFGVLGFVTVVCM